MNVKRGRAGHIGTSEDKLELTSISHCFPASKVGDVQGKLTPFIVEVHGHVDRDSEQLK